MRLTSVGFGFGMAVLLASSGALAAEPGAGSGSSTKGETGGKGGLGPGTTAPETTETPQQDTTLLGLARKSLNPDQVVVKKDIPKSWEIAATWETHRLIEQQYVSGSKTSNLLTAGLSYRLTEDNDILQLSGGLSQGFYADPGETGIRAQDLRLSYTHLFHLPAKFGLSVTGSISAPVGYYSQLASNITTPGVSVGLTRRFGDLTLSASVGGNYSWDRYTTAAGIGCEDGTTCGEGSGSTNQKWDVYGYLSAEYAMPFHRQLSVGVSVSDGYFGYYNVGSAPYTQNPSGPYNGSAFPGATTNSNTDNNPWQQTYGDQIYVSYVMPDLSGFRSNLTLALSNGSPSVLNDGIVHPYLFYYETSNVYFAYSGRY
jgi:hypothetical protein